jgi:predicted dehydrogenase
MLTLRNGTAGILVYDGSTRSARLPAEGVFSDARAWIDGRGWTGETGAWNPDAGSIRIHGSEGSLRVFHYANKLFLNRAGLPIEQPVPAGTTPYHFAGQMQAFCASLDRGEAPPSSVHTGIRALRALLAVYASESTGTWQMIDSDA